MPHTLIPHILFGMKDNRKYYKLSDRSTVTIFCYDVDNDRICDLVEECRSDNSVSVEMFESSTTFNNVSRNSYAKALIERSSEITKDEHAIAVIVANALIKVDEWLIVDNRKEIEEQPVVAEVSYA